MILLTRCEFSDRRRPLRRVLFVGRSRSVRSLTATSDTTLTSDDTNVNEANHVVATPILGLFPSSPLRHFTLWLTFFLTRILKIIIGFVDKLIQSQ